MNRNVLKIVAFLAMLVDHIGYVFFPNVLILRIIGRISMPIFAFFVAEGFYYTKSKKRYVLTLLLCMIISWVPFCLAFDMPFYTSNILGIFLLSILGMFLFDKINKNKSNFVFWLSIIILYFTFIIILDFLGVIPEGLFGVVLPIIFYVCRKNKILQITLAAIVLALMSSMSLLNGIDGFADFNQFFSLLALILIVLYNGNKGKANLKYLFYIGYPSHLLLYYIINILI